MYHYIWIQRDDMGWLCSKSGSRISSSRPLESLQTWFRNSQVELQQRKDMNPFVATKQVANHHMVSILNPYQPNKPSNHIKPLNFCCTCKACTACTACAISWFSDLGVVQTPDEVMRCDMTRLCFGAEELTRKSNGWREQDAVRRITVAKQPFEFFKNSKTIGTAPLV